MDKKTYKDDIIHFSGGLKGYIGRLDTSEHPNGPSWYRLHDPCLQIVKDNKVAIARMWGDRKSYRRYIDIKIPEDSIMEILTLDKNGELYKTYQKELKRMPPSRIHIPGPDELPGLNNVQ